MSLLSNLPAGWVMKAGVPVVEDDVVDLTTTASELAGLAAEQGQQLSMSVWDADYSQALQQWAEPQSERAPEMVPLSTPAGLTAVEDAFAVIESGELSPLAWVSIERDLAMQQLQAIKVTPASTVQPLKGIPMAIKDMFDRQGRVAQWGCTFRSQAPAAVQDATVYARLIGAGAINLGALHMAECALSPTGMNVHLGPGRNPYDTQRVSGGSSSGCAMVVGSGQVPLAIGSDTGGSIRIPAAYCGIYGLKPTQYRISLAGAMPLSPSLDCIGPLADSVELAAAAFGVMAGQDPQDPMCMRLPAPANRWRSLNVATMTVVVPVLPESAPVSPAMRKSLAHTVDRLKALGVRCVEVALPDVELLSSLSTIILATEAAAQHRLQMLKDPGQYGPQVRRRITLGYMLGATDYADAIRARSRLLARFMQETMAGAQACLLPAVPDVAPLIADTQGSNSRALDKLVALTAYWCRPFNYLGLPALSFPMAVGENGLPLGGQLVGAPLGEDALFALARALL